MHCKEAKNGELRNESTNMMDESHKKMMNFYELLIRLRLGFVILFKHVQDVDDEIMLLYIFRSVEHLWEVCKRSVLINQSALRTPQKSENLVYVNSSVLYIILTWKSNRYSF